MKKVTITLYVTECTCETNISGEITDQERNEISNDLSFNNVQEDIMSTLFPEPEDEPTEEDIKNDELQRLYEEFKGAVKFAHGDYDHMELSDRDKQHYTEQHAIYLKRRQAIK